MSDDTGFEQSGQQVGTQQNADTIINNFGIEQKELNKIIDRLGESLLPLLLELISHQPLAFIPEDQSEVLDNFLGVDSADGGIHLLQERVKAREDASSRTNRQSASFGELLAILKGDSGLSGLFIDEIVHAGVTASFSAVNPAPVIHAFYNLDDEEALDLLEDVSIKISSRRERYNLGRFAEVWLPVLFEHPDDFESIRSKLDDKKSSIVDIPFCLSIPIEMLLAKAAGVPPSFRLLPDNNIGASFDVGALPEVGLDDEGEQTEKAIYEAMASRCLTVKDNLSLLEGCLDKALRVVFKEHDKSKLPLESLTDEERMKVLRLKLDRLRKSNRRSYYLSCEVDDGANNEVFVRMKNNYPQLLFITQPLWTKVHRLFLD